MTQRLFIGVELTEAFREQLAHAVDLVRAEGAIPSSLRVLDPQTWHITLQFLGSVDDAIVADLMRACAAAVAPHQRFELAPETAGAFPNARRARVVWLGLGRGHDALAQLASTVQRALAPLRFEVEARAFQGHITWARGKLEADVRKLLAAFATRRPAFAAIPVDHVTLFRSHLTREGARYEPLQRFVLARDQLQPQPPPLVPSAPLEPSR